jgi:hypothetical protein
MDQPTKTAFTTSGQALSRQAKTYTELRLIMVKGDTGQHSSDHVLASNVLPL